ncbi:MAG: PP2C family protein-serine/threonine phosphatase [Actinomycetia bacterium]|nr:PP2C family protein-serine/threonine phosphatase [Actinomycetes bacterium]
MIIDHEVTTDSRVTRLPALRTVRSVRRALGPAGVQRLALAVTLIWTAVTAYGLILHEEFTPWASLIGIAVFAGLFLAPRYLAIAYSALFISMLMARFVFANNKPAFTGALVVLIVVTGLMFWVARSRARIGTQGIGGDTILVDLRDRLRRMGELPVLPKGWRAESAVHSAYGDSFSGDFIVASLSPNGRCLEIALVDVSGKGTKAGTRSLLLSGAFGGLLSAVPARDFLSSANAFLTRQKWSEGFATAVHIAVDLETGEYTVGSAGHPPALHLQAANGGWEMVTAAGPPLGIVDDFEYRRASGVLQPGDAMMLYTDGVIEAKEAELDDGIDRLLGEAELGRANGFSGLANQACAIARAGSSDDRAAVVLWRP